MKIIISNLNVESYEITKIGYICKNLFQRKYTNDKNYNKVKNHCHYTGKCRGAAHSMCNEIQYTIRNSSGFHSGLNYDYQNIINQLAKQFKGKFNGL